MPIQSGDVKLVKSAVMADVPEGGGAPTGIVIPDGVSNAVFPDISEVDRAGGRVMMRKMSAKIDTDDTDAFMGTNIIVAEPPEDPRLSVTLFATGETFDTRAQAQSRIESYLTVGAQVSAYLFGDHIAGQRTLTMLGRTNDPIPPVGMTFALRAIVAGVMREQYVRVTDVSSFDRTFTTLDGKDFVRRQQTLGLSDALRFDFPGQPTAYFSDAQIDFTNRTRVYDTVRADAARYFGVVPLIQPAGVGDFSIDAAGIYTQLVPSAQIETPIADARPNRQSGAAVAAGDVIVQSLSHAFTTTSSLYVGVAILPGTLTLERGGITLKDSGGKLVNQATLLQVGTVDYDNGVLNLTENVFGTGGGVHVVTVTPAERPEVMTRSFAVPVTAVTQRLSYVLTLTPPPAPGSLELSYRSGGRWYSLYEDGSGRITGSDTAFGAGTLNHSTGTMSVTLGALPDIDTQLILAWAPQGTSVTASAVVAASTSPLKGRFFFSVLLREGGAFTPRKIKPGTVSLAWNDGADRTITDNAAGMVSGYGVGKFDYNGGAIRFSPTTLPPKGTVLTINITETVQGADAISAFGDAGASWSFTLGGYVQAGTVELAVAAQHVVRNFPDYDVPTPKVIRVFDNGSGNLVVANISGNLVVGTVDYATGACTLSKSVGGYKDVQQRWQNITPIDAAGDVWVPRDAETRNLTLTILNGPTEALNAPAWAWWAGQLSGAAQTRAATADGSGFSTTVAMDELWASGRFGRFSMGSDVYTTRGSLLERNFSPATGIGTPTGFANAYTVEEIGWNWADIPSGWTWGSMRLTDWVAGIAPVITQAAGTSSAGITGVSQTIDKIFFRTAVAPIRNGSFSITGTTQSGQTFNITAGTNGLINTTISNATYVPSEFAGVPGTWTLPASVTGSIDYENGIVEVAFGGGGVRADTLRYNATAYTYLPLDADILGLDPVRLPQDGRVPIFRAGEFAVVGHTGEITATVSNGQTIDCGRVRLSRVRFVGADGVVIHTGYTADLEAGTVSIVNVSGWAQPVTIQHRIEDMALVREAQIGGRLTFTRPLTHVYPVGSYVSSALVAGDLFARVSHVFDQATWNGTWTDSVVGSAALATFNSAANPIVVTNRGALTERWLVRFTNTTSFEVVGEHVGLIAVGNTSTDCAPVNPNNGAAYFTIPAAGWGAGWSQGNVLRINTIGSEYSFWEVLTVQQGPETVPNHRFTTLLRGDVNAD
jgi:hypothetical protein